MAVSSHKKLLLSGVLVALLTSGCGWIHWRSSEPARDRSSIDSPGADVTFANDQKKARAEATAAASDAVAGGSQADAGGATTTPMPAADSDHRSATGGTTGSNNGNDAGGAKVSPMKDASDSVDAAGEQMQAGDAGKDGKAKEKVTLQGDALFQFGKADEKGMLPGGKQRLDELADKIMAMEKDTIAGITIVGHADRLGSPSGNLKISEKRAATVMNYLVRRGVDAAMLQSVGKGDADPITDCPGSQANKTLVACLSPNRRVEVIINSK